MSIKQKPKWFRPQWVTVAQITQMVIGVFISIYAFSLVHREECWAGFENNTGILIMYFSYFILFLNFFLNRFGVGINLGIMGGNTNTPAPKSTEAATMETKKKA